MAHKEIHSVHRVGWLRAAVLGANDGIVSTASLIIGVAASSAGRSEVLLAGAAGLVAGAMSMAAGEYVSVSSQADAEAADLRKERKELREEPHRELDELTGIWRDRGLDDSLAREVAVALTDHDALAAHARDELGISHHTAARPVQAAWTSAATFAAGAIIPLGAAAIATGAAQIVLVAITALLLLAILGSLAARAGGAPLGTAAARVTFWGALAMAVTAAIGAAIGAAV